MAVTRHEARGAARELDTERRVLSLMAKYELAALSQAESMSKTHR